jgi:hypothetical protein
LDVIATSKRNLLKGVYSFLSFPYNLASLLKRRSEVEGKVEETASSKASREI